VKELENHYLVWSLFENMVIIELLKEINNNWNSEKLYFFRDNNRNEVDLILDKATTQIPIEIKSSSTFNSKFSAWIEYWQNLTKNKSKKEILDSFVVYSGENIFHTKVKFLNWREIEKIV
jgi:predicted AAA+ superfamily ATPase